MIRTRKVELSVKLMDGSLSNEFDESIKLETEVIEAFKDVFKTNDKLAKLTSLESIARVNLVEGGNDDVYYVIDKLFKFLNEESDTFNPMLFTKMNLASDQNYDNGKYVGTVLNKTMSVTEFIQTILVNFGRDKGLLILLWLSK